MSTMGRPKSRPPGSKPKQIWFTPTQMENLVALGETNPMGRVDYTALVRTAVNNFIDEQMADPATAKRVREYQSKQPRVVNLRDVGK